MPAFKKSAGIDFLFTCVPFQPHYNSNRVLAHIHLPLVKSLGLHFFFEGQDRTHNLSLSVLTKAWELHVLYTQWDVVLQPFIQQLSKQLSHRLEGSILGWQKNPVEGWVTWLGPLWVGASLN